MMGDRYTQCPNTQSEYTRNAAMPKHNMHKVHCMHKGDPPANTSKCAELMFTVHSSHLLLMLTPGHPVTPAHPCSSVAICGHHCSPLLITADQTHEHQDRPLLITAHPCSSLLTTAHPCSSLLTRAHLWSSLLTPAYH